MLPQRHASNACARKMLALSRPKIAVTVSIIVMVHTPRPARDRMAVAQSKRFRQPDRIRSPDGDSVQQISWPGRDHPSPTALQKSVINDESWLPGPDSNQRPTG